MSKRSINSLSVVALISARLLFGCKLFHMFVISGRLTSKAWLDTSSIETSMLDLKSSLWEIIVWLNFGRKSWLRITVVSSRSLFAGSTSISRMSSKTLSRRALIGMPPKSSDIATLKYPSVPNTDS